MGGILVETQPAIEPIDLVTMKNFLRVEIADDDALINILITAAREACQVFTNRTFITTKYKQVLDSFPYFVDTMVSQMAYPPAYYSLPRYSTTLWNYSQMIKLMRPPLVSVERITYLSSTDQQFHDLTQSPGLWYPQTAYNVGDKISDGNGNVQKCTVAGTTDASPPGAAGQALGSLVGTGGVFPKQLWQVTLNALTTESTGIQWQNNGPATLGEFGNYIIDNVMEPGRIFPGPPGQTWPPVLYVPNAVQIHFTAGFGATVASIPGAIKTAVMQLVSHWYENRDAAMEGNFKELPNHVKMLLWTWRVLDLQPTRG